jgi:hypothetical protein
MTRIDTENGPKVRFTEEERLTVLRVLGGATECGSSLDPERIRQLEHLASAGAFEPEGQELSDLMEIFASIAASDLPLAADHEVRTLERSLWHGKTRPAGVRLARFSLDGNLLLFRMEDQVYLWDLVSGKEQRRVAAAKFITEMLDSEVWTTPGRMWRPWNATEGYPNDIGADIMLSRDHRRACIAKDNMLRIYDVPQEEEIARLEVDAGRAAIMSPDGKYLTTAGGDDVARVWSLDTGELIHSLRGHNRKVTTAVFSEDGQWIVTASHDGSARIWDASSGMCLVVLLSFPDGQWMVSTPAGAFDASWAPAVREAGLPLASAFVPGLLPKTLAESARTRQVTIH